MKHFKIGVRDPAHSQDPIERSAVLWCCLASRWYYAVRTWDLELFLGCLKSQFLVKQANIIRSRGKILCRSGLIFPWFGIYFLEGRKNLSSSATIYFVFLLPPFPGPTASSQLKTVSVRRQGEVTHSCRFFTNRLLDSFFLKGTTYLLSYLFPPCLSPTLLKYILRWAWVWNFAYWFC